jgi:hypothetical protein
MKRTYNIQRLAEKHGFQEDQIEKVCRISDILEDISAIPFLSQRLSLYGGTALNLIHFPQIPRLSADIDFNYRHIDEDRDWGNVRDQIDSSFKQILRSQTYREEDIKIDPSYPLSRFTVRYVNHLGDRDSFKIETGYMRRIPILREDAHMTFYHIGADIGYTVTTPMTEELYANNFYVKGLGLRDCVQRLGIPSDTCPSSEIITHYEAGNYAEIIERVTGDVLNTEKLFNAIKERNLGIYPN